MLQDKTKELLLGCFGCYFTGAPELTFRQVRISLTARAAIECAKTAASGRARIVQYVDIISHTSHCHPSSTSPLSSKFDFLFSSSLS